MITIFIPKNFIAERMYILDVLFGEFLGLEYSVAEYDETDYRIELDNNSYLIIRDSFFSCQEDEDYLKLTNIPSNIAFGKNQFLMEDDIPILYGNDELVKAGNCLTCGIDLFGSSFFMLSRWEEYVNNERDHHNRFPAIASTAYKNHFLNRPIVNEYLEMLWKMLTFLGLDQKRKERQFQFIATHDVDQILQWKNGKRLVRKMGGDLLKRKNPILAIRSLVDFVQYKAKYKDDPFDTFDWIMDLSEQANITSRFYFMSGGLTKYDNDYPIEAPKTREIIKRIIKRKHLVGFHPSYNAYNNPVQWRKEKERLELVLPFQVKEGREHFLRFEVPGTWQIWEDNGMEIDSTLGYADLEGFRCGTCYEFSVFNILSRKKLKLKERPLIAMEVNFTTYQSVSPKEMEEKLLKLLNVVKKYNGSFIILWHNSNFNNNGWEKYRHIYKKLLSLGEAK